MFGQYKAITKSTSNDHPNQITTNLMIRLLKEQALSTSLPAQDGEVHKLAQTLPVKHNIVIPRSWLESVHYQAHLERISDYLLSGPGGWWQQTQDGVKFVDVSHPTGSLPEHKCHHFLRT